jgi:hypothetical protein
MRKIKRAELPNISPNEIIDIVKGGVQLVDATLPFIKELFDKISEGVKNLGGPNSAQGKRRRIEALEAKDLLQKELNKLTNARLEALENKEQ